MGRGTGATMHGSLMCHTKDPLCSTVITGLSLTVGALQLQNQDMAVNRMNFQELEITPGCTMRTTTDEIASLIEDVTGGFMDRA